MKHPDTYDAPLLPGNRYHIYNRGNNYQTVFHEMRDYHLFLRKWGEFIHPVAKTFAYCLLPNHFHAAVEIREASLQPISPKAAATCTKLGTPAWVSQAFNRFFISYSRSMQIRYRHHGAVFHSPFKRKPIGDDVQLDHLIAYVHFNAHKHSLFSGPLDAYPHSSYRSLIGKQTTLLERDFVLDYFGGMEKFIAFHGLMTSHFDVKPDWEA